MNEDSLSDEDIPILVNIEQSISNEEADQIKDEPPFDASNNTDDDLPPVPVTILTGFLGSGKTTLIQYILRSPDHGKKIAVIENEFSGSSAASESDMSKLTGSLGLSIETLIARDGTNNDNLIDLIELPNGCICCTVKDSLVETLELLLEKKRELDYIIIECSGMANPGPIASIFWLDDALESRIRLDGVVTCVDARNLEMQLRETSSRQDVNLGNEPGGDEAAQQIAFADRIIVNKIDLLTEESSEQLNDVLMQIRAINGTAPIRTTTFSQIQDLDWVLDANCFDAERAQDVEVAFKSANDQGKSTMDNAPDQQYKCMNSNCKSCVLKTDASPGVGGEQPIQFCVPCSPQISNHTHTNSITTIALIESGSVSLKRMNTWLASILWPDQDKDDSVLTAELRELESIGQITTPELIERRKREETIEKMLIFRVKGILSIYHPDLEDVDNDDREHIDDYGLDRRKFIVQAVNDLWEVNPARSSKHWNQDDTRICKLVLIGRNLDNSILSSGFRACFRNDND